MPHMMMHDTKPMAMKAKGTGTVKSYRPSHMMNMMNMMDTKMDAPHQKGTGSARGYRDTGMSKKMGY